MEPIKGNSLNKSCGETISSNCVTVPIAIDGVCGPNPTLTQVLQKFSTDNANSCCKGTFPPGSTSAYTGNWVYFSAGIPLTGFFSAGTWVVSNMGGTNLYKPQYKWTQEGDLLTRGTLQLDVTSSVIQSGFLIPLVSLSPSNFPTNWTGTQTILTTTFSNDGPNTIDQTGSCLLQLDYPTGILYLNTQYITMKLAAIGIYPINLSARFNNA